MSSGRRDLAVRVLDRAAQRTELLPEVDRLRDRLDTVGVRAGDVVALEGLHGGDVLVAALAAWLLDAVPMPCRSCPDTPVGQRAFRLGTDLCAPPPAPGPPPDGLASTAVLHLSSGSTDRPKIVKRGVPSVLTESDGYVTGLSLDPTHRVLVPVPLTHSYGWGVAMSAMLGGCAVDAAPMVRPSTVARKIDSGAATVVALTAPLARLLADTPRRPGSGVLRRAIVGAGQVGDELDAAFASRFGVHLTRGYGSTETGGTFIGDRGIGRPVAGVEILHPPPGVRGELRLRLAAPVEGYLGAATPPSREWRTGDLVHRDGEVVHFVERLRPALRVNGRFVDAYHLERLLRGVPGVEAVYLLAMADPTAPEIETLYAMVAGTGASGADIDAHLAELPDGVPAPRVVRCARLPRDAVGKPDRERIAALVRGGAAG
ncbi:AMP-binding protein [Micromonospora sp. WMMD1102]|uniref:AMP-binding protein n=1 Tax=Micromonospora sp. WMMD1102 TaxID=3016105 RepID=UPI0024153E52|nr:AMP-binding protein [Micromonospora sp. WMMD1102]MDG4788025.1 AMP-binding protein [Micromonospora sp. WMMD1102]